MWVAGTVEFLAVPRVAPGLEDGDFHFLLWLEVMKVEHQVVAQIRQEETV